MRSRAETVRRGAELALRALALVALSVLLWRAVRPSAETGTAVARGGDLGPALRRWTVVAPTEVRAVFDAVPDARTRDWLRALAAAGTPVRCSASRPLGASAVVAEPSAEPSGATRVRLATAPGAAVTLRDGAGVIDTLPNGGSMELEVAAVAGGIRAAGATFTASTVAEDSVLLRPVLVIGAAGWESKFTVAALEERGWRVAARLRVAPGVEVTQGPLAAIDTARYSAVVALDSTASPVAGPIVRFARDGGGVVLAGSAARLAAFRSIAPGGVGRRAAGIAGAVAGTNPRAGLPAFVITPLASDAVTLESRDDGAVVAARRVSAGRVVLSGYDETWRWRMAGGDGAAAAHREWWSRLVAAVAYTPLVARSPAAPGMVDEAPLASLVAALGSPSPFDPRLTPRRDATRTTRILFMLVVVSLLLEWSSRRLRGAR